MEGSLFGLVNVGGVCSIVLVLALSLCLIYVAVKAFRSRPRRPLRVLVVLCLWGLSVVSSVAFDQLSLAHISFEFSLGSGATTNRLRECWFTLPCGLYVSTLLFHPSDSGSVLPPDFRMIYRIYLDGDFPSQEGVVPVAEYYWRAPVTEELEVPFGGGFSVANDGVIGHIDLEFATDEDAQRWANDFRLLIETFDDVYRKEVGCPYSLKLRAEKKRAVNTKK